LGGRYEQVKSYPLEKKLFVAETVQRLRQESGSDPTDVEVSQRTSVGRGFVAKVKEELRVHGHILRPDEIVQRRATGVGSRSLDEEDENLLLLLRYLDPTRSNQSYVENLYLYRGTVVSESLISNWFAHRFDHSGKFRVPNLIPVDKFKPENILRYLEFILFMSTVQDPRRLKFGDEKHPGAPPMNILVKYLPTRSPELNPIELVFQILVQRMKRECLLGVRADSGLAKLFAEKVFGEMTHIDMLKVTRHCYPNL